MNSTVIASGAKQSAFAPRRGWMASSQGLLAMTTGVAFLPAVQPGGRCDARRFQKGAREMTLIREAAENRDLRSDLLISKNL